MKLPLCRSRFCSWVSMLLICVVWVSCVSTDVDYYKLQVREALDLYYKGIELEKKKDLEGAKAAYLESVQVSPRPAAYLRLGVIELMNGNLDEADAYISRVLQLSPGLRTANLAKRQIDARRKVAQIQAGNTPETETEPQTENAATMDTGNTVVAAPISQPETAAQPTEETGQTQLPAEVAGPGAEHTLAEAKWYASKKEWDAAEEKYQAYLADHPDEVQAVYELGTVEFQRKQYESAEEKFRKSIELKPGFAAAYNELGIVLEYLGRSAEAIAAYQKSIDTGPYPDAFFNLAILKEKSGDYAAAIQFYQRYIGFDPNSAFSDYAKERIEKLQRQEY